MSTGRVRGRRALDLIHDPAERRAAADEVMLRFDHRAHLPVLTLERTELDALANRVEHVVLGERLLDEAECAEPPSLERRAGGAMSGHDHDRQRVVHAPETAQRFEPVHAGHLDVEKHQVRRFTLRCRQSLGSRPGRDAVEAFIFENHPHRVADGNFIVDNKNAAGHDPPSVAMATRIR
jgi:hypothetical protein